MNKSISRFGTKNLAVISLLIAAEIVLTRFLSTQTPIVRISFGFLPVAVTGILFGAFAAGCASAVGDIVGVLIFPTGAYFPGFTVTAFLAGMVYGLFLHKRERSLLRISIAVLIITIFLDLGLNTVWIWMITGKGILAILPVRAFKTLVMIPVEIAAIFLLNKIPVQRLQN